MVMVRVVWIRIASITVAGQEYLFLCWNYKYSGPLGKKVVGQGSTSTRKRNPIAESELWMLLHFKSILEFKAFLLQKTSPQQNEMCYPVYSDSTGRIVFIRVRSKDRLCGWVGGTGGTSAMGTTGRCKWVSDPGHRSCCCYRKTVSLEGEMVGLRHSV